MPCPDYVSSYALDQGGDEPIKEPDGWCIPHMIVGHFDWKYEIRQQLRNHNTQPYGLYWTLRMIGYASLEVHVATDGKRIKQEYGAVLTEDEKTILDEIEKAADEVRQQTSADSSSASKY